MYVVIVDIAAALLFVGGIALVLRRSDRPDDAPPGTGNHQGEAGIYARRIGGTMLAAFGLAIGLMVTLFHFASQ